MKQYFLLFTLCLFVFSCGSQKRTTQKPTVVTTKKTQETKPENPETNQTEEKETQVVKSTPKGPVSLTTEEYINQFSQIAIDEMKLYGIPASITLAQGILESSSGKGRLAVEANNHFGIKCHDWTGARIYHDDDAAQECFRKYNDAKYSYRDHSLFLTKRKRYSKLFTLKKTDYKSWAKELKAAGYATDRKYPDKLISLIERYELYKYDEGLVENLTVGNEASLTSSETHQVVKGDTLYSISKKYNTTVDALKELNSLKDNTLSIGQLLIISP